MTESSRTADAAPARALSLASAALADAPAGLLTDFDGTLSPIVADPMGARLVDGVSGALSALVARLAVVAIVTGRASLDARRMTGVAGVLIAGNHGTEWLEPGAEAPSSPSSLGDAVHTRLDAVIARVPPIRGVSVEHKGLSATVHYRNAVDPASALDVIEVALGAPPPGLEFRRGRMSVELRPTGLGDKGAATRAIIQRFGLRGVVVLGDDITDLDMFMAVVELRAAGRIGGAIIGVGGAGGEVPPEVAAAADVILPSPAAAADLLQILAAAMS